MPVVFRYLEASNLLLLHGPVSLMRAGGLFTFARFLSVASYHT
jgi:hypothetical protein